MALTKIKYGVLGTEFTTAAAVVAGGKDGTADLDAFKVAVSPAFASCKSCHEGYRIKK